MRINTPLLVLALLICMSISSLTSCINKPLHKPEVTLAQATPEVLTESNYMSEVGSFSRKGYADMVSKLYKEAGQKDKALQELHRHINSLAEIREDSLSSYQKYDRTNIRYIQDAMNLSHQIKDSTLREETLANIARFEKNYRKSVTDYEEKRLHIDRKAAQLHDQLIILKLAITQSMIKNYQVNEQPNIDALNKIIREYDEVLTETQALMD